MLHIFVAIFVISCFVQIVTFSYNLVVYFSNKSK